jgi:hypothetical protein
MDELIMDHFFLFATEIKKAITLFRMTASVYLI